MPQKTRLRKILAKQRKVALEPAAKTAPGSVAIGESSRQGVQQKERTIEAQAFSADIRRTLVITAVIIALEIGLYAAATSGLLPFIPQV